MPAGAAATAAAVLVLTLVLSGNGDFGEAPPTRLASPSPSASPSGSATPKRQPRPKPAHVRFRIVKLSAVPGQRRAKPPVVRRAAHVAALHVKHALDRLYTLSFTRAAGKDRAPKWLLGMYSGDAQAKARHHLSAVTIGGVGPSLRALRPQHASLWVRVLLDRHNQPVTAVAATNFKARGLARHDREVVVRSWGRFFLQPKKKGWSISGFDAKRRVREVKA